jgi:eukaryotic-like serine/threonine-protein kinase
VVDKTAPGATAIDLDTELSVVRSGAPVPRLGPGMHVHQYELIRELGRGGMGLVYAARDTRLGRRVAIKFLREASRDVAERFLVEARATAQCTHDNIVIIHAVDEITGIPYMVLEYLEGQSLRDQLGAFGAGVALPPARVVGLMVQVARALERAHELGIVHRDLKPENVFETHAGNVKVLDFGIAKALGGASELRPQPAGAGRELSLTNEGDLIGTLPYMSPEQMTGVVDHRVDLWAAGVMMFEMLAGHHPIEPLTREALLENLVDETPMPSLRSAVPGAPIELAELVDRLLRKDVSARLPSARELVARLERMLPGRRTLRLADSDNPYPGLTAFDESDADRFFGRARDVARMVARIREAPLCGVVGPSGVGKSSFVRAGVVPALKASEPWEVIALRPGRNPLAALASVVERFALRTTPTGQQSVAIHHELVAQLGAAPGVLGTVLRARARELGGRVLLFIDQFEELYTLVSDAAERRAFTAALAGVADDPASPLRVVISMRSDLLDRLAEDPRFIEELTRGLHVLAPPDRDGLREALVAPIELAGFRFETPGMVADMLEALDGAPGALPLLQFAAAKLWEARDRERRVISAASYHAIGGISGALATHATDVVTGLDVRSRELARQIFRQLVTPERTRAIVELADLDQLAPDRNAVARVIDQLVAARLLVVQTREGGGSVELVHESLIERWPTLRRWLDEDNEDAAFRAQLAAAAKQWDTRTRPNGLLWRGEAAEEAGRWAAHRAHTVPPRDRAFLDAVFAHRRRGRRLKRFALIAVLTVLSGFSVGASVLYLRMEDARDNARAAELDAKAAFAKYKEAQDLGSREADARAQAEKLKEKAQQNLKLANKTVEQQAQELAQQNAELKVTAARAQAAQQQAERASADARAQARLAEDANDKLNKALAEKTAKIKELELEKKKLSTTLK